MSDPRQEARQAFDRWARAAISAVLLEELRQAAMEAETSLWRYVGEVLEAHVATRRLPKIQPAPMGARCQTHLIPEPDDDVETFPWPSEVYPTALPRRQS